MPQRSGHGFPRPAVLRDPCLLYSRSPPRIGRKACHGNSEQSPRPRWRHAGWFTAKKDFVGTAPGPARLWFTVGKGIVTEVFYPRIDIPQVRDMGLIIADGKGFWWELKALPETTLHFTFYWRDTGQWQGEDFSITLQGENT